MNSVGIQRGCCRQILPEGARTLGFKNFLPSLDRILGHKKSGLKKIQDSRALKKKGLQVDDVRVF